MSGDLNIKNSVSEALSSATWNKFIEVEDNSINSLVRLYITPENKTGKLQAKPITEHDIKIWTGNPLTTLIGYFKQDSKYSRQSRAKVQSEERQKHFGFAQKLVERCHGNIENLKDCKFSEEDGFTLSDEVIGDIKEDLDAAGKVKFKQMLSAVANHYVPKNGNRPGDHCPPLETQHGGEWVSLRVKNDEVVPNQTEGTSRRIEEKANGPKNNLANFKYQIDVEAGTLSITSGVVDTDTKGDQYILCVQHAIEKFVEARTEASKTNENLPKLKLRLSMHQLNSGLGEKKLIVGQQKQAKRIDSALKEFINKENNDALKEHIDYKEGKPIVAYQNKAMNFMSMLPSYIEGKGGLSGLLSLLGIKVARYDHANQANITVRGSWISDDLSAFPVSEGNSEVEKFQEKSKLCQELQNEISYLEETLEKPHEKTGERSELAEKWLRKYPDLASGLPEKFKTLPKSKKRPENISDKDLQGLYFFFRKDLKIHLKQKRSDLVEANKELAKSAIAASNELKENKEASLLSTQLKLFGIIAAKENKILDQLTLDPPQENFSRMTEIELNLLLDMTQNCITHGNCKSGLDRTGLERNAWDALKTMLKDYKQAGLNPEKALERLSNLVLNQDRLGLELDQIQKENINSETKLENDKGLLKIIEEKIEDKHTGDKKEQMIDALKYRHYFVQHFITVGQPITAWSTGVAGGKYTLEKWRANPLAMARVPMLLVQSNQGDGEKSKKIVKMYDLENSRISQQKLLSKDIYERPQRKVSTTEGANIIERLAQWRGA
ncbi:MAG: hypothetical protein CMO81_03725 [Waddliaceae bacterium]|nr:hypothetical protein [Waddliaceae bacterium]